jgi:hypothetical protein
MAGWITMWLRFPEAIVTGALIGIAMLVTSVRICALRSDSSRNERAKEDLRWREMVDHGLREKV